MYIFIISVIESNICRILTLVYISVIYWHCYICIYTYVWYSVCYIHLYIISFRKRNWMNWINFRDVTQSPPIWTSLLSVPMLHAASTEKGCNAMLYAAPCISSEFPQWIRILQLVFNQMSTWVFFHTIEFSSSITWTEGNELTTNTHKNMANWFHLFIKETYDWITQQSR